MVAIHNPDPKTYTLFETGVDQRTSMQNIGENILTTALLFHPLWAVFVFVLPTAPWYDLQWVWCT